MTINNWSFVSMVPLDSNPFLLRGQISRGIFERINWPCCMIFPVRNQSELYNENWFSNSSWLRLHGWAFRHSYGDNRAVRYIAKHTTNQKNSFIEIINGIPTNRNKQQWRITIHRDWVVWRSQMLSVWLVVLSWREY